MACEHVRGCDGARQYMLGALKKQPHVKTRRDVEWTTLWTPPRTDATSKPNNANANLHLFFTATLLSCDHASSRRSQAWEKDAQRTTTVW
jgi:hypothetical protein